jgi:putative acetyltransferase
MTNMGDLDVTRYPDVVDPDLVGTYPAEVRTGGGYMWDEVLEYRVWCHPDLDAPDLEDGDDYYYAFATYAEALAFSQATTGAEEPLALIRQLEYIDEPNPGEFRHVKEPRIAEWSVEFLQSPRRTANTIPDFLLPDAPSNRLDILRGLANRND